MTTDYKALIYKNNSLTRAEFYLTLNEQRLILSCIALIENPNETISPEDSFIVTAPYFSRLFGIDSKNAYKELKEAADLLVRRVLTINNPDPDNPKLSVTKAHWASVDYYDGDGKVAINFDRKIIPYISSLKSGCFTKYRIERVSKIKSVYAIRIYELLISESWKDKDFEISMFELRSMFQLKDNEYQRIYDFKRYIVTPSVESINKHTDISVSVTYKKTGRNVTHLIFHCSIEKMREPVKLTEKYIMDRARPGESWREARERLTKQIEETK